MPARKANNFIVDEKLGICYVTTALTKKINQELKIWKADPSEIKLHEYEVIINYDEPLIELLKRDYLIYYNGANDIRRSKRKNPKSTPFDNVGYFWAMNIHTKARIPLSRLLWEHNNKQKVPDGLVVDHGNDFSNFCLMSNLSCLTQQQNIAKLKYPKRIIGQYSITMVSHPEGLPIKLLRFKDDVKKKQELLIYNTEEGIEHLLADLNSFKKVGDADASSFKKHFNELKNNSKNYEAHFKQSTTGDLFNDELFHYSVNWDKVNKLFIKTTGGYEMKEKIVMEDKLLSIKELAEYLNFSYCRTRFMIMNHTDIPRIEINNRTFFKLSSFQEWLKKKEKTI